MASSVLKSKMPGIDLLRGLAILAVIFFHGFFYSAPHLSVSNIIADGFFKLTGWGFWGVNLFFVLSGFLITGILNDTQHYKNYYERFYIRRALRILPVYVVTLLACWLTGFASLNYVVLCLFFLANIPGMFLPPGYIAYAPLWSLAVEEQFYLFWPFLYRRFKMKGILYVSLSLMVLCPLLRWLAYSHVLNVGDPNGKTPFVIDGLASGAILAILARTPTVSLAQFRKVGWAQMLVGTVGAGAIFFLVQHRVLNSSWQNSVGDSCFVLIFSSWVVMAVCYYRERALARWLHFFVFFGDISYGLYLLHMLCSEIYDRYEGDGYRQSPRLLLIRFCVANGIAIAIAVLSRRYYEEPIIRMRRYLTAAS